MARKGYAIYWWTRTQPYRDSGMMNASGIDCPECKEELWTMAPIPTPAANTTKDGDVIITEFQTYPAICQNGHHYRL